MIQNFKSTVNFNNFSILYFDYIITAHLCYKQQSLYFPLLSTSPPHSLTMTEL